jgi:uncharacterized membrane protein
MKNSKTNRTLYWVFTIWVALGMVAEGLQQIFHTKSFVDIFAHLGYPVYISTLFGVWKLLGVIAILVPGYRLLKEWAYAGFFFVMTGAMYSHIVVGDPLLQIAPSFGVLVLVILSWYFRPADRRFVSFSQKDRLSRSANQRSVNQIA